MQEKVFDLKNMFSNISALLQNIISIACLSFTFISLNSRSYRCVTTYHKLALFLPLCFYGCTVNTAVTLFPKQYTI